MLPELPLARVTEAGSTFETGRAVTFRFVRNKEKAPKLGRGRPDTYQQRIEPAGVYLLVDTGHAPSGWAAGTVTSRKPLVLLLNSGDADAIYDDASWKMVLARAFKAKGKALSARLLALGYDLIVTVAKGETREVVALDPSIVAFDEPLSAAITALARAAALVSAGDVRSLRPGGPLITIKGRKYVLSSDGGPLGDREDDDTHDDDPRIIRQKGGAKHRYLWVLNEDLGTLAMWRVSDGNEKHFGLADADRGVIAKLDKRGQMNRVSDDEFKAVEKHMRGVEHETLESLTRAIEQNKNAVERELDLLAEQFFEETVKEKLERAIEAVHGGAVPLGYKPLGGLSDEDELRRKVNSAMEGVLRRDFTLPKFEAYCARNGLDITDDIDIQATDFAFKDMYYRIAERYLPAR